MRKIVLFGAALLLAMGGFALYRKLSPTPPLQVAEGQAANPFEDAGPVGGSRQVGDVTIGTATDTRYVRRDPETKAISEVFGFEALMSQRKDDPYWEVKRPYMIRYEPHSALRIDADLGRMYMEQVGSESVLRSAELSNNVTIRMTRRPPQDQESTLYLDNLSYSSERSEFFTEGPIRLVSANAELTGRGLMLLYDPRLQQLEYMKVKEMDLLRLRNVVEPQPSPAASKTSDAATAGNEASADTPKLKGMVALADSRLYQCSILENVRIEYGRELVVCGADEVNINRILWGGAPAPDDQADPEPSATGAPAGEERTKPNGTTATESDRVKAPASAEDAWDVRVTCDGGIVFQPMAAESGPVGLSPEIEMEGEALRIDKLDVNRVQATPLASCRNIRYAWADETLEMLPGTPQKPITLYLDEKGGEIETQGTVLWHRRANQARIDGPGKILFAGVDPLASKKGQLQFNGLMDLFFNESPAARDQSSLTLKTAHIRGGMEALLPDQGLRSSARRADFHFGPSNTPRQIDLEGDVQFETRADRDTAVAEASRSTLRFDPKGLLQSAQLDGEVRMTSDRGLIKAGTAFVVFAESESGKPVIRKIEMTDRPVFENPAESGMPATFEAVRIDYDYLDGRAVAAGPVNFTFQVPADPNRPDQPPLPVTIHADDRAEFITNGGRLERASFYGNVVGISEVKTENERLVRRFCGQTMDVYMADDRGRTGDIRQVSVKDGDVRLQATHYYNGREVSVVRLSCRQFDYEGFDRRITATGPGRIELSNPEVPTDSTIEGAFDLRQPCYALVENFDHLSWNLADDRLIAYGRENILLSYMPVKDGQEGDPVIVECVHAVARMDRSADGRAQLHELIATGGIRYEDKGPMGIPMTGDKLTYRKDSPWAVIEGTPAKPARINNVSVPFIRFNPMTGEVESRLGTAPSPVKMR